MKTLACDLGGTNVRFMIIESTDSCHPSDQYRVLANQSLLSKDYLHFEDALDSFLKTTNDLPEYICIAAAGPVITHPDERIVNITNLPWCFSDKKVNQRFGFTQTFLINDFSAITNALLNPKQLELTTLQSAQHNIETPLLALGPGTGLGAAIGLKQTQRIISTEAGHSYFTPVSDTHLKLLQYLQHNKISTCWESVLSGPGLLRLHQFLHQEFPKKITETVKSPSQIVNKGLQDSISIERQVLELFLELLGVFSRNMVMVSLPFNGLYIAGGICPRIIPRLGASAFIKGYYLGSEHAEILKNIPIYLVTDTEIGLKGAIAYSLSQTHDTSSLN